MAPGSNLTVSVNHTDCLLLRTCWRHQNPLYGHTLQLETVKSCTDSINSKPYSQQRSYLRCNSWESRLGKNMYDDECHKSQPLWRDLQRSACPLCCFGFVCSPSDASAFVCEHQQQSFSNENHSSQSSLPESKGQRNLGKLLKLQSNLV